MTRILLINPPVTKPCESHAGLASIKGYLEKNGVSADIMDLNLSCLFEAMASVKPSNQKQTQRASRNRERNIKMLRSETGYSNMDRYKRAVSDLNHLLTVFGGDTHRLSLSDYESTLLSPVSENDLLESSQKFSSNLFYPFFSTKLKSHLLYNKPDIIGISINYLSQALCSFAISGFLRSEYPDIPLVAGGGLMTSWKHKLPVKTRFGGIFDSIITGRGESFLLNFMNIRETVPLKHCLPFYDNSQPFLSKGFVLPVLIEDGCYWKKCRFCPERAEGRTFQPAEAESCINNLNKMIEKTQPELIHFLDNALSPRMLNHISSHMIPSPWYGFVRFEEQLKNPHFCKKLKNSGCIMLQLGLESGSQHVLNDMEKGIQLESASAILKNLKSAGIKTFVYILFGTITESETDAEKTLAFVSSHAHSIDYLNTAIFNLPLESPDSDTLNLKSFYDGELTLYSDFNHPKGWQRKHIRTFLSRRFKKDPAVKKIIQRTPPVFTSNHAPFFSMIGNSD